MDPVAARIAARPRWEIPGSLFLTSESTSTGLPMARTRREVCRVCQTDVPCERVDLEPARHFAAGRSRPRDPRQLINVQLARIPVAVLRDMLVPAPAVEVVPLVVGHPGRAIDTVGLRALELAADPPLDPGLVLDP